MLSYLLGDGSIQSYIIQLLLTLPIILIALSLHETAHGYAAYKLGDPTAHSLGRLTLRLGKARTDKYALLQKAEARYAHHGSSRSAIKHTACVYLRTFNEAVDAFGRRNTVAHRSDKQYEIFPLLLPLLRSTLEYSACRIQSSAYPAP